MYRTNMIDCFLRHGFRRFLFLNGHCSNIVPAKQAVRPAV